MRSAKSSSRSYPRDPCISRGSSEPICRWRSRSPSSCASRRSASKDELPHAITVEVQELGERVIEADVLVETESQKQIVVGKGGSMVREIGRRARPEIEALLGHPVYLELRVKVKPRWRRDEALLERLGL